MRELIREYLDRAGLVTSPQLALQMGLPGQPWREPAVQLMKEREFFVCRLDHGDETFVSRHLVLCLRAVYTEPVLSPAAQIVYDWLYDNELIPKQELARLAGMEEDAFDAAFLELQQKLCITPLMVRPALGSSIGEWDAGHDYLWVTYEYWLQGMDRPDQYSDLEYCLSEIRRLMGPRFTDSELNQLIYRGEL